MLVTINFYLRVHQTTLETLDVQLRLQRLNLELFTASLSVLTPLTPVSDQDRISPYYYLYNINQMSDENKENYQLQDY